MFVIAQEVFPDLVMAQQLSRMPGILARDQVDRIQHFDRPVTYVLQVSDRCRNKIESSGHANQMIAVKPTNKKPLRAWHARAREVADYSLERKWERVPISPISVAAAIVVAISVNIRDHAKVVPDLIPFAGGPVIVPSASTIVNDLVDLRTKFQHPLCLVAAVVQIASTAVLVAKSFRGVLEPFSQVVEVVEAVVVIAPAAVISPPIVLAIVTAVVDPVHIPCEVACTIL